MKYYIHSTSHGSALYHIGGYVYDIEAHHAGRDEIIYRITDMEAQPSGKILLGFGNNPPRFPLEDFVPLYCCWLREYQGTAYACLPDGTYENGTRLMGNIEYRIDPVTGPGPIPRTVVDFFANKDLLSPENWRERYARDTLHHLSKQGYRYLGLDAPSRQPPAMGDWQSPEPIPEDVALPLPVFDTRPVSGLDCLKHAEDLSKGHGTAPTPIDAPRPTPEAQATIKDGAITPDHIADPSAIPERFLERMNADMDRHLSNHRDQIIAKKSPK